MLKNAAAWTLLCLEAAGVYEDVRVVGNGSFGVVANALAGEQRVAVKVLPCPDRVACHMNPSGLRELRALVALGGHPCVVQLRRALVTPLFDIVLEMQLYGCTASTLAAASPQGCLSAAHALAVVSCVAAALAEAHRHGMLHRDVKPANVLVAPCEQWPGIRAVLADWGSARHDGDAAAVQATPYVVTVLYAAPEALEGRLPYSSALDAWSLGVLAAELCSPGGWKGLFSKATAAGAGAVSRHRPACRAAILAALLEEEPPVWAAAAPPELAAAIRELLVPEPGGRTTAAAVHQALAAAVPPPTPPAGVVFQDPVDCPTTREWCRKHKVVVPRSGGLDVRLPREVYHHHCHCAPPAEAPPPPATLAAPLPSTPASLMHRLGSALGWPRKRTRAADPAGALPSKRGDAAALPPPPPRTSWAWPPGLLTPRERATLAALLLGPPLCLLPHGVLSGVLLAGHAAGAFSQAGGGGGPPLSAGHALALVTLCISMASGAASERSGYRWQTALASCVTVSATVGAVPDLSRAEQQWLHALFRTGALRTALLASPAQLQVLEAAGSSERAAWLAVQLHALDVELPTAVAATAALAAEGAGSQAAMLAIELAVASGVAPLPPPRCLLQPTAQSCFRATRRFDRACLVEEGALDDSGSVAVFTRVASRDFHVLGVSLAEGAALHSRRVAANQDVRAVWRANTAEVGRVDYSVAGLQALEPPHTARLKPWKTYATRTAAGAGDEKDCAPLPERSCWHFCGVLLRPLPRAVKALVARAEADSGTLAAFVARALVHGLFNGGAAPVHAVTDAAAVAGAWLQTHADASGEELCALLVAGSHQGVVAASVNAFMAAGGHTAFAEWEQYSRRLRVGHHHRKASSSGSVTDALLKPKAFFD